MNLDLFIEKSRDWKAGKKKTQADLAEAMGISLPYLRKVFYRVKPLTLQMVEKAAPVLGLAVHDFILGEPVLPIDGPPRDEEFGNIMGVLGKNLTPEMRAVMIEMARAAQGRGREREAAQAASVAEATTPYTAKGKKPPKV